MTVIASHNRRQGASGPAMSRSTRSTTTRCASTTLLLHGTRYELPVHPNEAAREKRTKTRCA